MDDADEQLSKLAAGLTRARGSGFFADLAGLLAGLLSADESRICELAPNHRARTLGAWRAGAAVPSFEYDLAGTPCAEVVGEGRVCFHRAGVSSMFAREPGIESFLGLPIIASDGRMLGHLAFFDSRPRGDDMLVDGDRTHPGAGAARGPGAGSTRLIAEEAASVPSHAARGGVRRHCLSEDGRARSHRRAFAARHVP